MSAQVSSDGVLFEENHTKRTTLKLTREFWPAQVKNELNFFFETDAGSLIERKMHPYLEMQARSMEKEMKQIFLPWKKAVSHSPPKEKLSRSITDDSANLKND